MPCDSQPDNGDAFRYVRIFVVVLIQSFPGQSQHQRRIPLRVQVLLGVGLVCLFYFIPCQSQGSLYLRRISLRAHASRPPPDAKNIGSSI